MRPEHEPKGDPCSYCNLPARNHRKRKKKRPEHKAKGDPCEICGLAASNHRKRTKRPEHESEGDPCKICGLAQSNHRKRERMLAPKKKRVFIGLDGEGQGRENHIYTFLAASTENGSKKWSIENQEGLSTLECLLFLITLPSRGVFTYFFTYDLTKILQDLPDELIYKLWRPGLRMTKKPGEDYATPKSIRWGGFALNMRASKFLIEHLATGKRIEIWDIGKFYQSKFTESLKAWQIGDEEELTEMGRMKEKRSEFDKLSFEDIKNYCFSECRSLAALARKLCEAHEKAELKLTSFYGAGSTATAILNKMNIQEYMADTPKEMNLPVSFAFFGGRFENSRVGKVVIPVKGKDISSAYPYQLFFLPCLKHAKWELTKDENRMREAPHALVHFKQDKVFDVKKYPWGPFPHRDEKGCICFPVGGNEGWVWKREYVAGQAIFSNIRFVEAWVYHAECNCRPFERIPFYYRERLRIGKTGPGIVLKLGPNSVYGKLAQSVGQGQYNSWIWAGMVTSGCRAQMLEMMALHEDLSNLLMIATDGLYTLEDIPSPKPEETGTFQTGLPLGGWEDEEFKEGVFMARPGIYFPLNPTEEMLKKIRGRGLGKRVILDNADKIISEFETYGINRVIEIANVSRFCGAKTSISRSGLPGSYSYKRASNRQQCLPGVDGAQQSGREYGQWIDQKIKMTFDPMPKRSGVNEDDGFSLISRQVTTQSMPYSKAMIGPEALMLKLHTISLEEQPDGDLTDYS